VKQCIARSDSSNAEMNRLSIFYRAPKLSVMICLYVRLCQFRLGLRFADPSDLRARSEDLGPALLKPVQSRQDTELVKADPYTNSESASFTYDPIGSVSGFAVVDEM
jgi:hypothetical protein